MKKFDALLCESIEESLSLLLDDSAVDSLFAHFEKYHSLKRSQIPRNPEALSTGLRDLYGEKSVKIEKLIAALFYSKLGLEYEERSGYRLGDYIKHAINSDQTTAQLSKLDEKDLELIHSLNQNPRKNITQLAKEMGLSRPTVANRLKRLVGEDILHICAGLNVRKLGFIAAVATLQTKGGDQRQRMERMLQRCPRVYMLFRPTEKADLMAVLLGEDLKTLRSTVESLSNLPGVELVDVHYTEPPLHPEKICAPICAQMADAPSCEMSCINCVSFRESQCLGCPRTNEYRGSLVGSPK